MKPTRLMFALTLAVAAFTAAAQPMATAPARRIDYAPVAATVAQWQAANDACQGEPIMRATGRDNPACAVRDRVQAALIKAGGYLAGHGVWFSREQMVWAGHVFRTVNDAAMADILNIDALPPLMLSGLRMKLSEPQIVALWNEQLPVIQAHTPYAATVFVVVRIALGRQYSSSHDPRLMFQDGQ